MVDRTAASLVSSNCAAVIAREDACQASFRRARLHGVSRIYLLPTAHHATVRRLMEREAAEFPEAFGNAELAHDFAVERQERKEEELKGANFVICPSDFVKRSVLAAGVPPERVVWMPFGAGAPGPVGQVPPKERVFLYVGKIAGRKGVHRLIRAWKRLGAYRSHRLRLIGDLELPDRFLKQYRGTFEHVKSMPRGRLGVEYGGAMAFVFNAIADGFGHVFAEAMACGTPVLASRNCGAPDLISDGVEGKLFDYGDEEALAATLDWALSHPRELAEMGAAARQRAQQCSWDEFGQRFLRWMGGVVGAGEETRDATGHPTEICNSK